MVKPSSFLSASMPMRPLSPLVLVLLIGSALLAGCGDGNPPAPQGVVVTGKVVKGGAPLPQGRLPPGEPGAEVVFVPVAGGESERQAIGADGTFREIGWEKGIKPGKYRLAVYHYVTGRGSDGLGGAFSEQNSPITVDIPADKSGSTHDLGTIELNDHAKK